MPRTTPGPEILASTIGALCDAVGPRLLEVVVAPRGLEAPVGGVRIHDPLVPPDPRDVVLLPRAEVEELLDAGVAAVVVKGRESLPEWMPRRSKRPAWRCS